MNFERGLDATHPRFVLLRHLVPATAGVPSHWDLMFEQAGKDRLLTLQLFELPETAALGLSRRIDGRRLADHRPRYLDYEGPISHGRGTVAQVAAGTYWCEPAQGAEPARATPSDPDTSRAKSCEDGVGRPPLADKTGSYSRGPLWHLTADNLKAKLEFHAPLEHQPVRLKVIHWCWE